MTRYENARARNIALCFHELQYYLPAFNWKAGDRQWIPRREWVNT